jgi:hypothetical protein
MQAGLKSRFLRVHAGWFLWVHAGCASRPAQMAKPACGSWLASDGDSAVTLDMELAFSSRQTQ